MDLTRELHGSFDAVLFAGVFYHLKVPYPRIGDRRFACR